VPFIDHLGFWRILIFVAQDRRAPRYFVLKAGTIVFGRNVIDCVVRNLSTSGAALEAPNQTGIPPRFILVIPSDGLRLACRVRWRKEHRVGVEFG
jgi:PilZ domain